MSATPATTDLSLRAAGPGDRFIIRRWLADPEVARLWGTAASAEAEITLALASPSALCRMVLADGVAVGYAHAADATLFGEALPAGVPAGTFDVDLFIGSADHRGRGLGRRALAMLTDEVFATTLAVACAACPRVANEAAVRAYEQAGFKWLRVWNDPVFGPSWIMLKQRP